MSCQPFVSWAASEAVSESARDRGLPACTVNRISAADWPTKAKRPTNSRLDSRKLLETFGVSMPDWRSALDTCLDEIAARREFFQ